MHSISCTWQVFVYTVWTHTVLGYLVRPVLCKPLSLLLCKPPSLLPVFFSLNKTETLYCFWILLTQIPESWPGLTLCYHTRKQFLGSQFKQALNLSFLPLLTIKSLCYVLFRDQTTVLQILSNQRTVSDCNSYLSLCYWSESPRVLKQHRLLQLLLVANQLNIESYCWRHDNLWWQDIEKSILNWWFSYSY